MSDDGGPRPASYTYLHVRTPYGPGGGPGAPDDYAKAGAEAGYTVLACSDYGTLASWPAWERACRAAALRPIYGLGFDVALGPEEGATPWPLLALAATGVGLRNLIQIHNRLQRDVAGRCLLDAAALSDLAAGLWLLVLPESDWGAAPLVALPRRAALSAVARLRKALPRAEQLLCGLPPTQAEQDYFADLAAGADLPLVALPTVRYPREADAPVHAILRAAQHPPAEPPPTLEAALEAIRNAQSAIPNQIEPVEQVAARYTAYPEALALAGAVAESCRATLADLAASGDERPSDAGARLASVVDESLAASGQAHDAALDAELAALARLGCAAEVLDARRVVAVARRLNLVLGPPGGVAGEGRVPALLGLCAPDPLGAPPRWLDAPGPAPAWTPALTVPATRRAALLAALQDDGPNAGRPPGLTPLPAGGQQARGPAAAVADLQRALALPTPTAAALEQALVAGRPGERPVRWRAALPADLPAGAGETLLAWTTTLEAQPGPPLADAEVLLVLPAAHGLPLVPLTGAPDRQAAAWDAADCAALGARLLFVRGEPALDTTQRAVELAGGPPDAVPADAMRLLLVSGDEGGLPLPEAPPGTTIADLEATPDVLAALCAALLPDDAADAAGWSALGALLYGPRGPHPLLRTFLRRRVGAAPVAYHYPALGAILDLTWGLPLYAEQVTLLRLLLGPDGPIPAGERLNLQTWIDQSADWTLPYAAALALGQHVHLALRLKVAQPAAFLAAALETTVLLGDASATQALTLEARRRAVTLRPPDVQASGAGFALEDGAVRWGLAWNRAEVVAAKTLAAARAREPDGRFASLATLCAAGVAAGVPAALLAAWVRAGAADSLGARADLLAALPAAWADAARTVSAQQTPTTADQASLFDIPLAPESPAGGEETEGSTATVAPATPEAEPPGNSDTQHATLSLSEAKGRNTSAQRTWEQLLAGHGFSPAPAAASLAPGNGGPRGGVARRTLGDLKATDVGQTVTVVAGLGSIRVLPADGGESLAVALAEDGSGALPLVLFPPVYTRYRALVQAEEPIIVTARVQLAEASAAGGAPVVLIGEQVAPFQVQRNETELDLTVRKRRAPAEPSAPRPNKAAPDPTQYSATGQRYFQAPRPATPAAAEGAPLPASATPAGQVVITLHPLPDEQEDEARMLRLKDILRRYPGPTGVLLYFPDDPLAGMPTYMPVKRTVAVSPEFTTEVDALLGAGSYEVRAG